MKIKKLLAIGLVLVMCATVFSLPTSTNATTEKSTETEDLKPDTANDEFYHIVWQENTTTGYQIFYANNKADWFQIQLKLTMKNAQTLRNKDEKTEKGIENIDEALNFTLRLEYEKSFESVKHAIQNLRQSGAETKDIIDDLITSVKDFVKCNILHSQALVGFNNTHIQKSWEHYYKAIEFMDNDESEKEKYSDAIEQFKHAYEEAMKGRAEWVPKSYPDALQKMTEEIDNLVESATNKKAIKELEKAKEELSKALEEVNNSNPMLEKSFDSIKNALHHLEKAEKEGVSTFEIRCELMITVKDFVDKIVEYQLLVENTHLEKAKEEYTNALSYMGVYDFDNAIDRFKTTLQHIKEAMAGVDFGKIRKISYTNFDSVNPQIFLSGTISVGWKEIMDNVSHVYYARSSDNGTSWWYFDATGQASTYLCYVGIDPYTVSIENTMNIVRTMERIWIVDKCHYFYAPIARDGFTVEDGKVFAPLNDPYLSIYDYIDPIIIDGKKLYLICGPGPLPVPPPKAPDLTVTSITFSTAYPVKNHLTSIALIVENKGDASASNIHIRLWDGEMQFRDEIIDFLDVGKSQPIFIDYIFTSIGTHSIIAQVDPDNNIEEGDESNNEMTMNVNVATAGVPRSDGGEHRNLYFYRLYIFPRR